MERTAAVQRDDLAKKVEKREQWCDGSGGGGGATPMNWRKVGRWLTW